VLELAAVCVRGEASDDGFGTIAGWAVASEAEDFAAPAIVLGDVCEVVG